MILYNVWFFYKKFHVLSVKYFYNKCNPFVFSTSNVENKHVIQDTYADKDYF